MRLLFCILILRITQILVHLGVKSMW